MIAAVHSSKNRLPWQELLLPWEIARNLWKHESLIYQFARRDLLERYRGSYLGVFWSLLRPLFLLLVYTIVFGLIFNARFGVRPDESRMDYALALFSGLILFEFVADCINRAPLLVLSSPNYVTKVVFPLEVLSMSSVLSIFVQAAISAVPLFLGLLAFHGGIPMTVLYLPVIVLPLFLLCLGITWWLSSLGVFIRDINSMVPVFLRALIWISAIFYPISKVPSVLQPLIKANPLALVTELWRNAIMWGIPPDWGNYLIALLMGIVVMISGYAFFMRTKRAFADVI